MKIGATVILYHPDLELLRRILSYLSNVDKLFVLDNTEGGTPDLQSQLTQLDKVVYLADGENRGISERLNQAANLAINEGLSWLLTMDQDSYFPENMIPQYFTCIEHDPQQNRTAMFGVQTMSLPGDATSCDPREVTHLITSGSVVNLSLFQEIGPFDEALFIDRVDHEYCFRARTRNFKIVRLNNIFMHHSLGSITYGRSLKNFKLTPRTVHSPVRMYYIFRNYFYLKEKYKGMFLEEFKELKRENWIRSKNNFLYGRKKLQLLRYLFKAYLDFKKGRMGRIPT